MTHKDIAKVIATKKGLKRMLSQAIGRAIGKNKILIIILCHRVISVDGDLVGDSAGLDKKFTLLNLEKGKKNNTVTQLMITVLFSLFSPLCLFKSNS